MAPSQPTARQRQVLAIISSYIAKHGFPPTLREIAATMGIRSPNGVMRHLDRLEELGLIGREDGKARGLRVVERNGGQSHA